jgi:cation diffusion facilitator family transporter
MASGSKKVILAALIGNLLISITKFAASILTKSSAMFSEGIHSLVDTGNQVLLLFGMSQAKKPADKNFPFGHGKEIYFWSFAVAVLIFAVGAGISLYEGIRHIIKPSPITNYTINYVVLGLSIVFEGFAWFFAWKEFKKQKGNLGYFQAVKKGKDPTLFVVLFEDSAAMLSLLVALLGIFLNQVTGIHIFDGIASVIIGLILGGTAVWLAYETKSLLIGEAAEEEVVAGINSICSKRSEVEKVNEVLTLHMGPEYILVNMSVDFRDDLSVNELEKVIEIMASEIKNGFPRVKRVFLEAEEPK